MGPAHVRTFCSRWGSTRLQRRRAKVSGWSGWEYTATTSDDFLLLPTTSSVSCSRQDPSQHTLRHTSTAHSTKLIPVVSLCVLMSAIRLKLFKILILHLFEPPTFDLLRQAPHVVLRSQLVEPWHHYEHSAQIRRDVRVFVRRGGAGLVPRPR